MGLFSKPIGFWWDRSDIVGATSDSLKRFRNSKAGCARGEAKNSDSSRSMPTETCMRFLEEKSSAAITPSLLGVEREGVKAKP